MATYTTGSTWAEAQKKANAANEKRYSEAKGIYEGISAQYAPGGKFQAGALASFERQKLRDMATANQSLVSSGLFNTTIAAGLPSKYEEEVGTPFRLNLEDIRMQRYGEAQTNLAGLIERREDVAPDPSLYANLMQGASSGVSLGPNASKGLDAFGQPFKYSVSPGSGSSSSYSGGNYNVPQSYTPPTPKQQPTKTSSIGTPLTPNQVTYGLDRGYGPVSPAYANQLYSQDVIRKVTKPNTIQESMDPFGYMGNLGLFK
jgi:hypothetical protein